MVAAAAAGAGHPVVAALFGLGAAAVAGLVVVMAWSVHVHQFRLAEQMARRQLAVDPQGSARAGAEAGPLNGTNGHEPGHGGPGENGATAVAAPAQTAIDGPGTVVTGEQVRYRLRPSNGRTVVSWAVGGGSVWQAPDPAHPDELLLTAERPGALTVMVLTREGMAQSRVTKPVTAVAEETPPAPPFTLRLFLHGWALVVVAVLITGFAGALDALSMIGSADFIALVAPLAALLGMAAVARAPRDPPPTRPAR